MSIRKLEELIPCFLELISINNTKRISLQKIADKLGVPLSDIEKVVAIAQSSDLISVNEGGVKLTEKGKDILRIHREKYIHDRYIHPRRGGSRFFRRKRHIRNILRKNTNTQHIKDWHKHGLNNSSVEYFYQDLEKIQGRIENIIPLTQLPVGVKATFQFMFGGRGQVQRLADMGLTPGAEISINKKAPFHGPIEICIRNACLAIGYGIAKRIFVKPQQS